MSNITPTHQAALYARVSSDRQKEDKTIDSQVAALLAEASIRNWQIPEEWIFRDEGYSGATLERPALETLRDLVYEGEIQTIVVYAPDRLARKFALQALLLEEFSRHGARVEFIRSVKGETPEEELLLQMQGMIAEYERSMIVERCRRGKRHKAKQGRVNVLCGAPYGYHYHRVTEISDAFYEIKPQEAAIVRQIFVWYTEENYTIAEIVRKLNKKKVPTKKGQLHWERSTVWGILQNPAYKGKACFGKTKAVSGSTKRSKKQRERGGPSPRSKRRQDVPQDQWIEIDVPAIVEEKTFEWAQQRLAENAQRCKRRTPGPSLLQSLLVCDECGYAMYRKSTRTSAGNKIYYYRCTGSDNFRFEEGKLCERKPIRVDMLDEMVWEHLIELLQTPKLVEEEIERRKQASRESKRNKRRQQELIVEVKQAENQINKLLDAYQEDLLELDELRRRTNPLQERSKVARAELAKAQAATLDDGRLDTMGEEVAAFLSCLRERQQRLTSEEKQQIVRLLVKEIVISKDTVKVHHSIPIPKKKLNGSESWLLCTGGQHRPLGALEESALSGFSNRVPE
jgi:site-specific DNA recombinase